MDAMLKILFCIAILGWIYEAYKREQAEKALKKAEKINHGMFSNDYYKGQNDLASDLIMKLKTEIFIWSLKKNMEENK